MTPTLRRRAALLIMRMRCAPQGLLLQESASAAPISIGTAASLAGGYAPLTPWRQAFKRMLPHLREAGQNRRAKVSPSCVTCLALCCCAHSDNSDRPLLMKRRAWVGGIYAVVAFSTHMQLHRGLHF